jgi:muramoyltetrapeptide carboxypeptidase
LHDLDIEVIAPSSGTSEAIWQKVFDITGAKKKSDVSTKSSDDQVFANHKKKSAKLIASLTSSHKIIWAIRGGYGLGRIMPDIVNTNFTATGKKTIIGYSDITPLLIFLSQKYNWTAIHGAMLKDIAQNDKSHNSYTTLFDLLRRKTKEARITGLIPLNAAARVGTNIKGKITGGNITCIVATIGTSWQIETRKKILILEDTGAQGYRLDRILSHMENARLFEDVVCIILGDFGHNVSGILKNFAERVGIPVYQTNKVGHGKTNLPFVYNSDGTMAKSEDKFELVMKIANG